MIKTLSRIVAFVGICAVAIAPLLADATADAKKALQGLYDKTDVATAKKDIKGITANFAPDFHILNAKGEKQMDLAQAKTQMEMVLKQIQNFKAKTVVQKVTLKGASATVTVKQTVTAIVVNPQKKQPSTLEMAMVGEDVWAKTSGGWKLKTSKNISSKQTLDGKTIPTPEGN